MRLLPVVPRRRAVRDVDEAIDHYLAEGGVTVARAFIDGLERAYRQIARCPDAGSPRYAQELDLPELRFWPVPRFPHLVFYVAQADRVDVWRVPHGGRDIPDWMSARDGA